MREIVLDTETTGLDPKSGDRLVEIAGLELINHLATGKTYHQYINPERDMPQEAFAIHGLSEEFLSDKPIFSDIAGKFLDFIGESQLIIHNAAFDIGFLNHEITKMDELEGIRISSDRVIDTLELARRKHPFGPNSLDALCRRYNIDNSARTLHGALLDCELLAEVYLELIGGRQPVLGRDAVRETDELEIVKQRTEPRPAPLAPRLSEHDIAAHTAFVETLGSNAIWHKFGVGEVPKTGD